MDQQTHTGFKNEVHMRSWSDYQKTMHIPDSLHLAAKEGNKELIGTLFGLGHDLNEKDHRGYSPLMLAAYAGEFEASQHLIKLGADVNSCDPNGNTILMGAAFKGNMEIAKLLVRNGADLNTRNLAGMDAYEFAVTFGRTEIARFLSFVGMQERKVNRPLAMWKLVTQRLKSRRIPKA